MPSYKSSEPSSRPDLLEPGDYTVEVIEAEESIAQSSQNDKIELKLKIEPSGAIVWDNLVFTPNAFWKIDAFRAATGELVIPDEDVEIIADDLIGRRGRARLIVEEHNGKKRNKVGAWLVPTPKTGASPTNTKKDDDDSIPF
jgi:hypothetical protein